MRRRLNLKQSRRKRTRKTKDLRMKIKQRGKRSVLIRKRE